MVIRLRLAAALLPPLFWNNVPGLTGDWYGFGNLLPAFMEVFYAISNRKTKMSICSGDSKVCGDSKVWVYRHAD